MLGKHSLFTLLVVVLFCACRSSNKYPYAIKDFRKELQPILHEIVDKGVVSYYDSSMKAQFSDKELKQLSLSEHPILRAFALRVMLKRKTINHQEIILNHLDDTAIVAVDAGEWDHWLQAVSHDMLLNASWRTEAAKNEVIDIVLRKHNYLYAAYSIVDRIEPAEKYYPFIKEMAFREKWNRDSTDVTPIYNSREIALYALARYKHKEDIDLIKAQIIKNQFRLGDLSFKIMQDYPDTAYLSFFELVYPKRFYNNLCKGDYNDDNANAFIKSIAVYRNERSARILDSIYNKKPFGKCPDNFDTSYLRLTISEAIWENPCKAYSKLLKQVEPFIMKRERDNKNNNIKPLEIESATIDWGDDTSLGKYHWLY